MKFSRKTTIAAVLTAVLAGANIARADLGTVWVEKVTTSSITINWSDPEGIHRLYRDAHHYRVCWEAVDPYRNVYPTASSTCEFLFGSADRPHAIEGLASNTYYRIKVEAFTEKRDEHGNWENPIFRQVSTIRQKTLEGPGQRNLRLAHVSRDAIVVEFVNPPREFDKFRFAYKQKWSSIHLTEVAGDALMPDQDWGGSDGLKGWQDQFPAPVIQVEFPGLLPGQAYEVVVYGHKIGLRQGEHLGRVTCKTAGYQPLLRPENVLAAHFQDVLDVYGRRLSALHESASVYDIVKNYFPSVIDDKDFLIVDEGDDLYNNLTMLMFLISARWDIFAAWQQMEKDDSGLDVWAFLGEEYPSLVKILNDETDPWPTKFQRGDVTIDGKVDISDAISIMEFLFCPGGKLYCKDAGDTNDDGAIHISDAIFLLSHLFTSGPAPAAPYRTCDADPTYDGLNCEEFNGCPM